MRGAIWVGLWLFPLAAVAAPKEKLALLPVQSPPELANQARIMEELIAADVAKVDRFEVLASSDVATLLTAERQKELAGCDENTECLKEIAMALGTGRMLVATLGTLGDDLLVGFKVVDFSSGKVLKRDVEQVPKGGSVINACHRLVARVLDLPPPPSKGPRVGWFVFGGASLLALGGLGVGLWAQGDVDGFRTQPTNGGLASSALTKAYAADALYAAAAVTAVVAIVLLVLSRGEP